MSAPSKAVFLSYASQDAEAARRICEAFRAAGIEVWFDQSELRGGDAWDQQIRRRIKECALFIPLISSNTDGRIEGYFRLEWKLAVDRSHLMADDAAFLLPVAVDEVTDATARVPDKFRAVQWTRLTGGHTPEGLVDRVSRLLSPDGRVGANPGVRQASAAPGSKGPSATPAMPPWLRPLLLLAAAAAAVGAGIVAVERLMPPKRAPAVQAAAPEQITIPEKSIAVLPFVDLSEKKDQAYFADGMAEEVLDLLAQVPDLIVAARTSSFSFKDTAEDIATIGRKLRVEHLLEGSVRKSGHTLRVTAQLIRADSGYNVWSMTYDRDVKDVFKVQDEIAAAVVGALKAKLLATQQIVNRHRTGNTEAYAQYLLGNQLRQRDTPEPNRRALAAYQRAVALDPGYAAAWSGVAEAEWRIADMVTGESAAYTRAAAAADKAVALAPDSPEGYWARGRLRNLYFFDWNGAAADYAEALALDPNYVPAAVDSARLQASLGRVPQAIETLNKAVQRDPLSIFARRILAALLFDQGDFEKARNAAQDLLQISDNRWGHVLDANVWLLEGKPEQALAIYRTVEGPPSSPIGIAMSQYSLGHAAESQQALDRVIQEGGRTLAYQVAQIYAWRREPDKAFEWLDRAYRQHDGGLVYVTHDRFMLPLRGDPRFAALLRKLNLPE